MLQPWCRTIVIKYIHVLTVELENANHVHTIVWSADACSLPGISSQRRYFVTLLPAVKTAYGFFF